MKVNNKIIGIMLLLTGVLSAYNELTDIYFEKQPGFAEIMLKFRNEVTVYRNYMEKNKVILFFSYMDYFKTLREIDINEANVKRILIKPGKEHTLKVIIVEKERSDYKVETVGNIMTVRIFPPRLTTAEKPESVAVLPQIQPSTIKQILNLKTIKYQTYGKSDVFKTLVNESADSNLLDPLTAKLVGVIMRGRRKVGIFQDKSKKTFILKEGARVKNGKLWKLSENQAIFLVGLRGYARTVRIKLKNPTDLIR